MSNITNSKYWNEIESMAEDIVSEAMESADNDVDNARDEIYDYRLHEGVDGHEWVIYYAYNDDVLEHTYNEDAYKDVYSNEDIGRVVAEQGMDSAKTIMAYFAMYQDVAEKIESEFDEIELNT